MKDWESLRRCDNMTLSEAEEIVAKLPPDVAIEVPVKGALIVSGLGTGHDAGIQKSSREKLHAIILVDKHRRETAERYSETKNVFAKKLQLLLNSRSVTDTSTSGGDGVHSQEPHAQWTVDNWLAQETDPEVVKLLNDYKSSMEKLYADLRKYGLVFNLPKDVPARFSVARGPGQVVTFEMIPNAENPNQYLLKLVDSTEPRGEMPDLPVVDAKMLPKHLWTDVARRDAITFWKNRGG